MCSLVYFIAFCIKNTNQSTSVTTIKSTYASYEYKIHFYRLNGFWDGGGILRLKFINAAEVLGPEVGRGGGGGTLELKVTVDEIFGDISNELEYGRGGGTFGLNPIPNGLIGGAFWEDCTDVIGLEGGKIPNLEKLSLGFLLLVSGKGGFVCGVQNGDEQKELFGTTGLWRGGGGEFIDEMPMAGNVCRQLVELGLKPDTFELIELWMWADGPGEETFLLPKCNGSPLFENWGLHWDICCGKGEGELWFAKLGWVFWMKCAFGRSWKGVAHLKGGGGKGKPILLNIGGLPNNWWETFWKPGGLWVLGLFDKPGEAEVVDHKLFLKYWDLFVLECGWRLAADNCRLRAFILSSYAKCFFLAGSSGSDSAFKDACKNQPF